MNRQIKFRAWDIKNKSWLNDKNWCLYLDGFSYSQEEYPVMQFTGLLDKNGKEIYEGDILFHKDRIYWVIYRGYKFALKRMVDGKPIGGHPMSQIVSHPENFEVIGNIFENKDLLEGQGNA